MKNDLPGAISGGVEMTQCKWRIGRILKKLRCVDGTIFEEGEIVECSLYWMKRYIVRKLESDHPGYWSIELAVELISPLESLARATDEIS